MEAGLHSSISVGAIGRIRKYGSKTEVCKTDEEEAEARGEHFKQLLEREVQYKDGIEDELEQQVVQVKLDKKLTKKEVGNAIMKLNASGPGLLGVHALAIKAMWLSEGESQKLIFHLICSIWEEEDIPDHWVEALLKILSKPGI